MRKLLFAAALAVCPMLGSFAQTPTVVKDVLAQTSNSYYIPYAKVGSKIFYEVNFGELWVTDGTPAGTILLKNYASDEISTFHEFNGKLYFFADGDNNNTSELWMSDGTVAGTVMVKNVLQDYDFSTGYSQVPYLIIGSKVYYDVNFGELWASDGSAAGTLLVKNFPSEELSHFHELNGKLLFFGDNDNNDRSELWTSDGTVAGTVLVKNVLHDYSFSTGSSFIPYILIGSKYFYEISFGELWVTDGTAAGTLQLKNYPSDEISTMHVHANTTLLFFADGDNNATSELWKSDGTVAGTVMVKNVLQDYGFSTGYSQVPFLQIGTKTYYDVNFGELWVSDATAGGTVLLKNFPSEELSNFHELNGKLLFFGDNDNNDRSELWTSDGTTGGTVMVKNVLHDYSFSTGSSIVPYAKIGSKYFYEISFGELWVTDGAAAGTIQLKNYPSKEISTFHEFGGKLQYFADGDNNATSELWKSDGTVAGTVMVKNTLHDYSFSTGYSLVPYLNGQNKVFYDVNFGELWASDGTAAGTVLLRNYPSNSMWQFHTLNDDLLYFADDNNNSSLELWTVSNSVVSVAAGEDQLAQLQLSPVPAHDILRVKLDAEGMESAALEVVDLSGKVVLHGRLDAGAASLDVRTLPAGMYLLRAQGDANKAQTKLFVVQ